MPVALNMTSISSAGLKKKSEVYVPVNKLINIFINTENSAKTNSIKERVLWLI
jgi:hypothetical protein